MCRFISAALPVIALVLALGTIAAIIAFHPA
jgi:hypothetical protein